MYRFDNDLFLFRERISQNIDYYQSIDKDKRPPIKVVDKSLKINKIEKNLVSNPESKLVQTLNR